MFQNIFVSIQTCMLTQHTKSWTEVHAEQYSPIFKKKKFLINNWKIEKYGVYTVSSLSISVPCIFSLQINGNACPRLVLCVKNIYLRLVFRIMAEDHFLLGASYASQPLLAVCLVSMLFTIFFTPSSVKMTNEYSARDKEKSLLNHCIKNHSTILSEISDIFLVLS